MKNIIYLILISGFSIGAKFYNGKKPNGDFPFHLQSNAPECGPTCLQMIFEYYGKKIPRDSINTVAKLDKAEGTNLFDLSEAAEHFGFRTLGVKLKIKELREAPLPAMLHWNDNHFVVLYAIEGNTFYVADPAVGLVKHDEKTIRKEWCETGQFKPYGVALLLEAKK
ncbi:cysteine peptidase family C39 domain-containing protein [Flavobacterium amniphilum]|uniref:cysteine peptidase family C39 domain-containing protein n=1 Tax=Flavobacterium amniphilum TaxID=1834035 RepID=UPI00202AAD88|nr:cysteine peptidase family C39 domain-containing protein [Flavobacterium amniphilum]MCL9804466.1 cysteine peptidase family C39 domain-containing protein [Flavobacterium amniphilum]